MLTARQGAGQYLLTDGDGAAARYPVVPSGADSEGGDQVGEGVVPRRGRPRSVVRCATRRGARRLLRQGLLETVAPVAIRALDVTHGRSGVLPAHVFH